MCVKDIDKPTLATTHNSDGWVWPRTVPEGIVVLVKPCHEMVNHLWYTDPLAKTWKRCHRNSPKAERMLVPLEGLSYATPTY